MSSEESRQHQRHPARWRAALIPSGTNHIVKGVTLEISRGGAGLYCDEQLPNGTQCRLILEIPSNSVGNKTHMQQDCVVVHSSLVGNVSKFRTGIKFKTLAAENEKILAKFLR